MDTSAPMPRDLATPSYRRAFAAAATTAAGVWGLCLWAGWSSGIPLPVVPKDPTHQPWSQVLPIFATNASAALGLYSGVLTLGTSTVANSILIGLFAGSAIRGASDALGPAHAAGTLLPYFAFEGAGLIGAATAGLLPIAYLAWHITRGDATLASGWRAYTRALGATLPLAAGSLILLLIGAVLEVAGGLPR